MNGFEKFNRWIAKLNKRKAKEINHDFNFNNLFNFWVDKLTIEISSLWKYDNLPFPQHEIEKMLIYNGKGLFVKSDKFKISNIGIVPYSRYGVTEYSDKFTSANWVTPLVSKSNINLIDSNEVVEIYNNSYCYPTINIINRYAYILANIDISLKCALINLRQQVALISKNSKTKESIEQFYVKIECGESSVIVDDSLTDMLENIKAIPLQSGTQDNIKTLLSCYDSVLQNFFNEFGIRYNKDKKERMITSEVESDSQRLLFSVENMYNERKQAIEKFNEVFGYNVTFDYCDALKPNEEIINDEIEDDSNLTEVKKDGETNENED